ncbi:hypothetical protein NFHSH190041_19880 [Shewanella sp. NFH-SH190041]|uniref:hypothetical protein n=1 Tax=Shewanella sp. NFH-SH190041 TaxID=2950245 RepID=UPI0021C2E475|nr:hypothetical protein [Shewanella sp. NFH-SH190041]BDM64536.1 hypothetical protein NFHSH190041_19880 [Shewanella sp. NFH-SH190041]
MAEKATAEQIAALNPNILQYPCSYFGNGVLPEPNINGYKYRHQRTVVRSQMDLGLTTMRRRCRTAPINVPLVFTFSGEQKEVFESWVFNELDAGVEWFYCPLLTGDYRLEIHKVRFTKTPGEDSDFELISFRPEPHGRGRMTMWKLTAEVQAFRANKLEKYNALLLSTVPLTGLEKAAAIAFDGVNKK